MNRIEFDIEFGKLRANPWEFPPRQDQFDKIEDLYFDKLRNHKAGNWRVIVSKLIDVDKKFPTFNRIYACAKEIIGDKDRKDYAHCPACGGSGYASMLLSFEHVDGTDGQGYSQIKDKHFWAIEKQRKLMVETGDRFYSFAFFCRCEKGEDLFLIRGSKGYQLKWEEFEELKSFNRGGVQA